MNLYKQVKHLYQLLANSKKEIEELKEQKAFLEFELSGNQRAKQNIANELGVGDEPRWKWILIEIANLQKSKATNTEVLGELYQVLGTLDAPAIVLDQVLAASNGEKLPYESLLPFHQEDIK